MACRVLPVWALSQNLGQNCQRFYPAYDARKIKPRFGLSLSPAKQLHSTQNSTTFSHRIIRFFINVQVQYPHQWAPFQVAGLLHAWQISHQISRLIAESFHSLQSFSLSYLQVILGLPGQRLPSTCMSKAVLTAPLELST